MSDTLPKSYDAWRTWTPDQDEPPHLPGCPLHDDTPTVYACGGVEEHFCSLAEREVNGCAAVVGDCDCPTKAALEADRAEARAEARSDR